VSVASSSKHLTYLSQKNLPLKDVPSPVDFGLIINGGLGLINSSPEADAVPLA
jgi:hypothetical protein